MKQLKIRWDTLNVKKLLLQILFYGFGIAAIPLGVCLIVNSNLGAGGIDTLNFGLSRRLGIRLSYITYITASISLIIASILRKSPPRISTFVALYVFGLFFDFWQQVVAPLQNTTLLRTILLFLCGNLISGIGIACYTSPGWPTNPNDELQLAIHQEMGISFGVSKLIFDGGTCLVAVLVGEKLGIGTVLGLLILPAWVHFVKGVLKIQKISEKISVSGKFL